jgi:hypothetical protein
MDRLERLNRIAELKQKADAGRARIAARVAAREADPFSEIEQLLADRRLTKDENDLGYTRPVRASLVRKSDPGGLLYRITDNNAPASDRGADDGPSDTDIDAENARNQKGWDDWIAAHLRNERGALLDMVTEAVAEFTSGYVSEKLQPLRTEIADLKRALAEREQRAAAISEVKKQYAGERLERDALQLSSALALRDARIAALEDRLQMLLRFLSLSDINPPKGL